MMGRDENTSKDRETVRQIRKMDRKHQRELPLRKMQQIHFGGNDLKRLPQEGESWKQQHWEQLKYENGHQQKMNLQRDMAAKQANAVWGHAQTQHDLEGTDSPSLCCSGATTPKRSHAVLGPP